MMTEFPPWLSRGAALVEWPVAAVRLDGPAARRFANNMFTNNVRDLPAGVANRHALTDDRGRVQGFLDLLCEADDRFVAMIEGLSAEAFLERFERYVVFDDVEMTALDGLAGRLVVGPDAAGELRAAGVEVPEEGRFLSGAWGFAWRRALGPVADAAIAFALYDPHRLDPLDAPAISDEASTLLRVVTGHATHPHDTGPRALPHELGLRDVVLNFDKGCYLGQESINRIDVMGQVKRHLRALVVAGEASEGDVLHDGKVVGRFTSPVRVGDRTWGLAILRQAAAEPGAVVRVGDHDATVLAVPVPADAME